MSGYVLSPSVVVSTYYVELILVAGDTSGSQAQSYVDDVIQTIDEPEGLFK